jgi:drug/metabolite transporter (DMT)-like permease
MGSATLVITPIVAIAWLATGRPSVPASAWLLAVFSGLCETAYFIFLSAAYERGDLSLVYPVARGTAPLLAVLAGLILLHEHLNPLELIGVACLLVGLWVIRRPVATGPAMRPALLTGLCIAAYSTINAVGVHRVDAWLYGWTVWMVTAPLLLAWTYLVQRGEPGTADDSGSVAWSRSVVVGLLSTAAYFLTLAALRLAPLALVAPVRESAIVVVASWGMWRLGERGGVWLRAAGAVGIALGAILIASGTAV